MAQTVYGYISGCRRPKPVKVDSSSAAIVVGDMLTLATAGYFKRAAAGDNGLCVAMQASAVPSADGGYEILADWSKESVYAYPPASGSAVQGDVGKAFDLGGPQSVDRTASVDGLGGDGAVFCVGVDLTNNLMHVTLNPLISGV